MVTVESKTPAAACANIPGIIMDFDKARVFTHLYANKQYLDARQHAEDNYKINRAVEPLLALRWADRLAEAAYQEAKASNDSTIIQRLDALVGEVQGLNQQVGAPEKWTRAHSYLLIARAYFLNKDDQENYGTVLTLAEKALQAGDTNAVLIFLNIPRSADLLKEDKWRTVVQSDWEQAKGLLELDGCSLADVHKVTNASKVLAYKGDEIDKGVSGLEFAFNKYVAWKPPQYQHAAGCQYHIGAMLQDSRPNEAVQAFCLSASLRVKHIKDVTRGKDSEGNDKPGVDVVQFLENPNDSDRATLSDKAKGELRSLISALENAQKVAIKVSGQTVSFEAPLSTLMVNLETLKSLVQ